MAGVLRGDIFWAQLGRAHGHEQGGQRPVPILSHEFFNERFGTVMAVAIVSPSQQAGFPLALELEVSAAERHPPSLRRCGAGVTGR